MTNVLDINLNILNFSLEDYDDENGYFVPSNNEVLKYKENLLKLFEIYKTKLRIELSKENNITQIVKYDVILFYLYDMYINSPSEYVGLILDDEEECVKLWIEHYLQAFEDYYPKMLKITY